MYRSSRPSQQQLPLPLLPQGGVGLGGMHHEVHRSSPPGFPSELEDEDPDEEEGGGDDGAEGRPPDPLVYCAAEGGEQQVDFERGSGRAHPMEVA